MHHTQNIKTDRIEIIKRINLKKSITPKAFSFHLL